jgi:hypothetical protein
MRVVCNQDFCNASFFELYPTIAAQYIQIGLSYDRLALIEDRLARKLASPQLISVRLQFEARAG